MRFPLRNEFNGVYNMTLLPWSCAHLTLHCTLTADLARYPGLLYIGLW
jgi:hypothetical protein